jgi:hypothetical protein
MKLNKNHRHTLLSIAEWAITDYLESGKRNPLPGEFNIDKILESKKGAFVSVYVKNKLRGCIGTFSESDPLFDNVHQLSIQAATEDRRFKAVKSKEISDLKIEISVLSPRKRINSPSDIVIGKHGIYLIHGIRRATLLPQVAVKNRWNAIEFLECCAENKLGLNRESWKEAELYVYEAVIID